MNIGLESRLAELEKNHAALNTFSDSGLWTVPYILPGRNYEFGDKPGRYLTNLVKKGADSQNIVSITDSNGVRLFDTRTINKQFASFYSNLYSSEQPDNALTLMPQFFADFRLPKATVNQKLQLNAPITREEALLALKSMRSIKMHLDLSFRRSLVVFF